MNDIEQRVNGLLAKMTVAEKIGQLNELAFNTAVNELKERVRKGEVGVLVAAFSGFAGHEGRETEKRAIDELQRIAVEESRLGIPMIMGRDVIHGHHTVFPIPLAQAASWDPDAVREAAGVMAAEAYAEGIHWTYAPMMDISRDPRWGRIIEGYGEDPFLASVMARAAIEGFQNNKIAACAKHYAGYGASEGGRDYNCTEISEYTLRNIYLRPFKASVDAGVMTVMPSFNDINGEPVSGSYHLLTEILKGEYGFDGFLVSDWDAVQQLIIQGVARNQKEAAEIAFNAGVDVDGVYGLFTKYLPELLEEGRVSMERLDDAVRRVLRVKFRLGLFEKPRHQNDKPFPIDTVRSCRLAASGMVLLQNREQLLPLRKEKIKIAIVGPMADERRAQLGGWTLDGRPEDVVTITEGIRFAAPGAEIIVPESALFDDMLTAARKADVVIAAIGESHDRTAEARSVADISLSPDQINLLEKIHLLNDNIVAVVCAGRPVALEAVCAKAKAVLYAWHSGIETGNAAAGLLFGGINPCGKLPVTFPRSTGQIPLYYNHRPYARNIDEYYNGQNIDGYGDNSPQSGDKFSALGFAFANYQDCRGSPLFPFGYGLQYTSYEYSGIKADKETIRPCEKIKISANVKNIGNRQGIETVQCYVRDDRGSISRPVRELKGFQRTLLNPGESKIVEFTLSADELSFYNKQGKLVLEPGTFTVWIGGDCLAEQSVSFELCES